MTSLYFIGESPLARGRAFCTIAIVMALGAGVAMAQDFPRKPVRIVIGFPAGGPIDVVARIMTPRLFEGSGYPVIVDNRAGANGIVAMDIAAKAVPDGHTIFFGTAGNLAVNPSLYRDLPFDVARDYAPVSHVASAASLLYLHPSVPAKTLGELIAHASANPGRVNFGSSGAGSLPHLAGELLNSMARIRLVHVPYKGTAPFFNALLAGEVQIACSAVVSGLQHVKTGRVRALATTGAKRLSLLPDVPAANETLPGFEVDNWYGIVAPSRTPQSVVARLRGEIVRVLGLPDVREKLIAQGMEPVGSTPEVLGRFMKAETEKWARVIRSANIRPE
jgi:tripartite-type tricarboxylate transporter receptor subunit TctC